MNRRNNFSDQRDSEHLLYNMSFSAKMLIIILLYDLCDFEFNNL